MFRILAALILFAGAAHADPRDRAEWNPPTRYDKPYAGKLIEYPLEQQAVRRYCNQLNAEFGFDLPDSMTQRGCSFRFPEKNTCIIVYISHRYGLASPDAVRRHEIGHCNGWPAHHPD